MVLVEVAIDIDVEVVTGLVDATTTMRRPAKQCGTMVIMVSSNGRRRRGQRLTTAEAADIAALAGVPGSGKHRRNGRHQRKYECEAEAVRLS
jgi:chemotaxis response regulator CheB